ncbi:unnamed protein product [Spirodela intermedia]|uniref:Uncharacterized protein n=1 Tax=Spirodela intermedia TaxID=51605 RepID=A0A7I8JIS2_SPIIN|nr:unnamed protein product [Spirodela intermedia]CAA6670056.1 unnamed protein product [Spirodela intermedia]
MCISAWIWQAHPSYPFLLVLNRDEYHERPTMTAEWWGDGTQKILGGRDVQAGGTWLGCTRNGRLAFLTNVLEPDPFPDAKSRGALPVKFLECEKSPLEFAEEVAGEADKYNGFNLVLADLCSKTMVYVSNRPKGEPASIKLVPPGFHVLSNAGLDSPELLYKYDAEEEIPARELVKQLMCDRVKAERDRLPNTGCDSDMEWNLSSIFVEVDTKRVSPPPPEGLAPPWWLQGRGDVEFYEAYLEMGVWKDHTIRYQIESLHQ